MTPFWIALQFLTVFPVQLKTIPSTQQNGYSLLFYPIIGLLIGLILFALALLMQPVPPIMQASLILVIWIWLTGGLHLDGLADTADAWVGGFGDAERTLKIMKDPACGPIGVLSLIIACILKWSAIYVLLEKQQYSALILFPIFGRLTPLYMFLTTPYVRAKGLGSAIAHHLPHYVSWLLIALFVIASFYFSWLGLVTSIAMFICWIYLRRKFIQRIGGITGDTIGASVEITECVSLWAFALTFFIF